MIIAPASGVRRRQPILPARLAGMAAAVIASLLLASCGSGAESGSAKPAAVNPHTSHGSSGALPSPAPLRAGEHFINLTMPQPYTPAAPGGGTDEYRCFLVDPNLASQQYLTGSQFEPQNAEIVHHAIFFRIDPEDADRARQLDAGSPGEGWTCFGSSGVGDEVWVAAWAPGMTESLLQPGLGYSMPPGSLMVMQVHYNLLATHGKAGGSDQSSIRLRLTAGSGQMKTLETALLPAPI
jgi:hypothetical protein